MLKLAQSLWKFMYAERCFPRVFTRKHGGLTGCVRTPLEKADVKTRENISIQPRCWPAGSRRFPRIHAKSEREFPSWLRAVFGGWLFSSRNRGVDSGCASALGRLLCTLPRENSGEKAGTPPSLGRLGGQLFGLRGGVRGEGPVGARGQFSRENSGKNLPIFLENLRQI